MKARILTAGILCAVVASAFAHDEAAAAAERIIAMKDGATLYVFKDGKMAMENKYGRAVSVKEGEIMETRAGQELIMVGNQVALLERLISRGHRGGGGR